MHMYTQYSYPDVGRPFHQGTSCGTGFNCRPVPERDSDWPAAAAAAALEVHVRGQPAINSSSSSQTPKLVVDAADASNA
jgi:hypothetical protein